MKNFHPLPSSNCQTMTYNKSRNLNALLFGSIFTIEENKCEILILVVKTKVDTNQENINKKMLCCRIIMTMK